MSNIDEKITSAEIKLENNDFAGAIEDYRTAAIHMPTEIDLVLENLGVAEIQERLAFARKMSSLYPDLFIVGMREASLLLESRFTPQAIKRFSELIVLSNKELLQETRARLGRLEADLRAGAYQIFIEDFLWLWKSATLPLQKQHLLRFLAKAEKTDFISILKQLLHEEIFSSEIKDFIQAKINELELLSNGLQYLDITKDH